VSFSSDQALVVASILREAAEAEILPRFRNLTEGQVRHKSSVRDLVTDADEAAEERIEAALRERFPGCVIVGEEATERDAMLLGKIADADLAFIVDPVDGTKNFSSGLPLFGTMAAVTVRGEVVAGIIHDPIDGDWAIAVKGEGAWVERQDAGRTPLRVSQPVPLAEMEGCISWYHLAEPLRSRVPARMPCVASVASYRCAAHEYRTVASGHCHFVFYAKLMPWDHAAGWLLHQEAGGYSARFDGSAYKPTHVDGGLICATDEGSWHALREALLNDA
jgi:fructose-1,6-bisphosphatase/inositol monophosphatase family enzyme